MSNAKKAIQLTSLLAASLVTTTAAEASAKAPEPSAQPNVLMILVDDLKPNLGAYGDETAISPNIDRLAAQGIRFDMAYANQAVCMPSRVNLMLGSRSTSTGVYNFGTDFRKLYPNAVTLPQQFMNAGYTTESIGKVFHVGHGNVDDKASWTEKGYHDKVIDYVSPENVNVGLTQEEALFTNFGGRLIDPKYAGTESDNWLKDIELLRDFSKLPKGSAWEAADVDDKGYADGRTAEYANNRLEKLSTQKGDKPFFMAVGFARPHMPFSAPKKYWDMYDADKLPMAENTNAPEGAPRFAVKRGGEVFAFTQTGAVEKKGLVADESVARNLVHGYYASISYMDAQVGKVLKKLEETGLAENTIVVLWGDHGFHLGDHGSWTKHSNYEEAVKIPLIFKMPGKIKPNTSTTQLAETVDIYPTLTSLAGITQSKAEQSLDGEDLVPVLEDSEKRLSNYAYHVWPQLGGKYVGYAIRTEQYRMVKWAINKKKGTKYKYELYDYQNDPLETKNIAKENPEVVKELERILDAQPKPVGAK
ncbi:sulfatase [Photobacterium sagamiensis]|uniref:sulfatase n=1 Tax=Photobacterium sagamiensis TaxID=2910241 RepID=UPI003D0A9614